MTRAILVPGTFAWRGSTPANAWYAPTSAFAKMLTGLGLDVAGSRPGERGFTWSTDLNGVVETEHIDWRAGGCSLYEYVVPSLCEGSRISPAETTVIAHSHGRQVALYAAAAGLKIGHLVTVCSPVRLDMAPIATAARPNIGTWTALSTDDSDDWQIPGEDQWCPTRDDVMADANINIPGVGHSGFLEDAVNFPRWAQNVRWLR